jgi:alcohol dehydrogenase class IV
VIEHKLAPLYGALGVNNLEASVNRIQNIMALCGLETRLRNLGIKMEEMDLLINNIRWDRMGVLPRSIGRDETVELLQSIF